jgi:hypothetical protein
MYFDGQKMIKDLTPFLAYLNYYYGKEITLADAIEVAGRMTFTLETLDTEGHTYSETDVYENVIQEYLQEIHED